MASVTWPPLVTAAPISSSVKVARARPGTAAARRPMRAARTGGTGTAVVDIGRKRTTLFSGSGVLDGIPSGHQGGDELAEEGPAAAAGVVHELEEDEVERQLLLRDAAARSQPGAQQRPDPFHGVDVHLAEAVAVLVPRVLAPCVTDRLVPVAPLLQASIDVVLVGVDEGVPGDRGPDDWLDRRLLDIGQHPQHHLPAALDQAEHPRLVLRQRAAARRSRQPTPPPEPPPFATSAGRPLCPATT